VAQAFLPVSSEVHFAPLREKRSGQECPLSIQNGAVASCRRNRKRRIKEKNIATIPVANMMGKVL